MLKKRDYQTLRAWWKSPPTTKDRSAGAIVGCFGGFWAGVFARIGMGALPVSLGEVLVWECAIAMMGMVFGIAFPKPVTIVLFPFSVVGGSN